MDWIALAGIALGVAILVALDRWAALWMRKMLTPKVCTHPSTHTSYLTTTTRCTHCGDILRQD